MQKRQKGGQTKVIMKKIFFLTVMLAFGLTGFAQTQFIAVADGDWNTAATWDQNAVPGAADFAKIAGGWVVTVQSSTTAECAIVDVGDVNANGILTVSGTLNISETAGNSLTLTHANTQVTVNGTLTFEGNVDVDAGLLNVFGSMEYTIPTVTNPTTGEIWMDRNLGASQVATSSTDAAAYGDLYQWGRLTDGHQIRTSGTTPTPSSTDIPGHDEFIYASPPYDWRDPKNNSLWQGVSGINNPCPAGFRLPTATEWDEERLSWATNDPSGAFGSPLKLTLGGTRRVQNGDLFGVGSEGYYWSYTINDDSQVFSNLLRIFSPSAVYDSGGRSGGMSVRCIKD